MHGTPDAASVCHLCLGFLDLELLHVEVELLAFQDDAVGATALAGSAGDFGVQLTLEELTVEVRGDLGLFLSESILLFGKLTAVAGLFDGGLLLVSEGVVLLSAKSESVVVLVV